MDPEFLHMAAFLSAIYYFHYKIGDFVAEFLDAKQNLVLKELQEVDDILLVDIQAAITENENLLAMGETASTMFSIVDELSVAQAAVFNSAEEHNYREAIVRKLDSLVALEVAAAAAIRNRMLTTVHKDVVTLFTSNKAAKENALNQAIAVLHSGSNAKMGKDIVGEAFTTAIKSYKDTYSKLPAGSDDLLVQLEKDMAAIAVAPLIAVTGGNVYLTNPIIPKAVATVGH